MTVFNGIIYCLICKVNGKVYVGQTTQSSKRRLKGHLDQVKSGAKYPLHRAIRKHGIDNFDLAILENNIPSIEELNTAEAKWILELDAFTHGYNCTTGGEGFTVGKETRQKISAYRTGRPLSEEHRHSISLALTGEKNPFYGKKHKSETVEAMRGKLSKLLSGQNNPFSGCSHTQKVKKLLADVNRGKKMPETTRAAIVATRRKLSDNDIRYLRSNPDKIPRPKLAQKFKITADYLGRIQRHEVWGDI